MIEIRVFEGDRADLTPLMRMADDSASEIRAYRDLDDVLAAWDDGAIVGIALVEEEAGTVQVISLAVEPSRRGHGVGCALIEAAAEYARLRGTRRLLVCTGAWEAENRAFYLKRGFRLFHVEPGFFTPEKGYAEVGDQVQFERPV